MTNAATESHENCVANMGEDKLTPQICEAGTRRILDALRARGVEVITGALRGKAYSEFPFNFISFETWNRVSWPVELILRAPRARNSI